MNYEGRICRPPMERGSFMLPIMVGCSYNHCKFCNLFRDIKFRVLPFNQIADELNRVKKLGAKLKNIFLGDGNAFSINTKRLLRIFNLIHIIFPTCEQINMDATVSSILQKTDSELKSLYDAGVRVLYLGIESGLDDVLSFMKKDHSTKEAKTAINRLHNFGFEYGAHIMSGVAGKGRSIENAEKLADFFLKTKPKRIINFSMFLHNEVPLYEDIIAKRFQPANEYENLLEIKHLIELLCKQNTWKVEFDSSHDFLAYRVKGVLPNDKNKIILSLENKIAEQASNTDCYAFVCGKCDKELARAKNSQKVWSF